MKHLSYEDRHSIRVYGLDYDQIRALAERFYTQTGTDPLRLTATEILGRTVSASAQKERHLSDDTADTDRQRPA
jgi:hypothetical protein